LATKRNNPLFDKIIAQGGGPVLISLKDTAVKRLFKRLILKFCTAEQRYVKFVWGKPTTIKDAKDKDVKRLNYT
jgi:SecD/SecF fusion protein